MFPYKTSLKINKKNGRPIYLQLANQLIELIKERKLPPNTKLPGSRTMANLLGVHRKTIVACYEELILQGWVEGIPKKGTFVHSNLPLFQQHDFLTNYKERASNALGFTFYEDQNLKNQHYSNSEGVLKIDDGVSDERLVPIDDIARIYRKIAGTKNSYRHLTYGPTHGNEKLREVLVNYLNETRGLKIKKEQLLITRGSQMGTYLAAQLLLQEGDAIVVGETNYVAADITFKNRNARLLRVPVDEHGLDIKAIEQALKKTKIKAVFVTSHHHHPTTVTLSAERRIHLLNLAKEHHFAIIEDDYDYDFNYNHAPILPLASHDIHGNVIYIGSVCKTVAPVFRIGYLIAPKEFVDEAARLRRIIDRQGDALLELTFAEFIKLGDLDRHIRKVLKIYQARRNLFCKLLQEELSEYFEFSRPKGGMAVWVRLYNKYSWSEVASVASKYKLEIGNWKRYDMAKTGHNSIRIGFATKNENELRLLVSRLKEVMTNVST